MLRLKLEIFFCYFSFSHRYSRITPVPSGISFPVVVPPLSLYSVSCVGTLPEDCSLVSGLLGSLSATSPKTSPGNSPTCS